MIRFTLACLAALASLFFTIPAGAQDSRGRITGRVVDSTGAVMPAVQVTAVHAETNVAYSRQSNESGNYDIPYLPLGVYTVSAEAPGFKKFLRGNVEVRVDSTIAVEITMAPGEIAEAITVTAETPILEASTTVGQVIDTKQIEEMPLPGDNVFALTQMASGVTSFGVVNHPQLAPALEVISNIGGSGTRSRNTEFAIDGAPSMWGQNASYVPPAGMVSEFKVQTFKFDAGMSRSAGGAVNVALKSGTNKFHGTLSHTHNNNSLQAMDFFQRRELNNPATGPATEEKRRSLAAKHVINRFGVTAGGPVHLPGYNGKNRTFWIYGFEGFVRPQTSNDDLYRTVPTMAQRQGDFSALLALGPRYQIYDPATIASAPGGRFSRQPFPDNKIPPTRIDPVASGLLQWFPEPNVPGTADGRNNYFRAPREWNEYWSHLARVDHVFSQQHRIFGRYHQAHQVFQYGQVVPGIATGVSRNRYTKGFGFDDVYLLSPSMLLNFRYSLSRMYESFTPFGQGFDLAAAGFSKSLHASIDAQALTFPSIDIDGYVPLGTSAPAGAFSNYHTWALDLSRSQGKHSLRFGGEFRLYREHNRDYTEQTPSFDFGTTWTRGPLDNSGSAPIGQGLASFLLGLPSGGRVLMNASYAQQSTYTAGFVQDDWKITPRVALNLGVRYEYEAAPTERFNRSVRGFDATAVNPLEAEAKARYAASPLPDLPVENFHARGGLTFVGAAGQPRQLFETSRRNFAPRVGLSWMGPRRTVLRMGYGLFYFPSGVDRIDVNQAGFSQPTNIVVSQDNGQSFTASLGNPFPQGYLQPRGASRGLLTNTGRGISFFPDRRPHAYAQRWTAGIQKQIGATALVEVCYVGTRNTRQGVSRQLNAVPREYLSTSPVRDDATNQSLTMQVPNPFYPALAGTDLSGVRVARQQLLRPYPQFTGITFSDPAGYSWYHSMQVRLERRMRAGLVLSGNYSWAKFMEATSFLNATDPMPEKVISDQDRPHRVVGTVIYELPFGRRKRFASGWTGIPAAIVSGWQASAIYQAQSGAPLAFGNISFYGDIHDIVLPRGERTVYRWFNTQAGFERDSTRQLVNNIRTFPSRLTGLRGPGTDLWNMSASKNFRVTESVRFQIRAQAFNAFNRTHFSNPSMAPANTLFGTINSANGRPRQIHLAGRLTW